MTFDWSKLLGEPVAVDPGFVPHFRAGQLIYNLATGRSYPLNDTYFATMETAQFIASKFGDGKVYEVPFEGEGFGTICTAKVYATKLPNAAGQAGRGVNCGVLAGYYLRNPEAQFPGLAEKLIRGDLEKG